MEATQIRQRLHEYIDTIDEEKLEDIYLLLVPGISESHAYSADELTVIYQRRKECLPADAKSITVKETTVLMGRDM